ncbi:hypothetical protein DFJ73DRAFT_619586 [Zopfochytrium polystomum]|nr:hypothetical protein DFJ73DRAFT_619586 [Zopfochytrium polystomum]
MKIGERARFLCMPEECEGYAQLESILRQESENRKRVAKGQEPMRTHGCCAHFADPTSPSSSNSRDLLLLASGATVLEFEIHLLSVAEPDSFAKEVWEMNAREKYKEGPAAKAKGDSSYRAGEWADARIHYERALVVLESLSMSPAVADRLVKLGKLEPSANAEADDGGIALEEEENMNDWVDGIDPDAVTTLMQTARLNYAAVLLKLSSVPGEDSKAVEKLLASVITQCTEVLKKDPQSIKALLRRAQAHLRIGRDLELAEADLKSMASALIAKGISEEGEASAEWRELRRWEKELERRLRLVKEREKKMFGKMFG